MSATTMRNDADDDGISSHGERVLTISGSADMGSFRVRRRTRVGMSVRAGGVDGAAAGGERPRPGRLRVSSRASPIRSAASTVSAALPFTQSTIPLKNVPDADGRRHQVGGVETERGGVGPAGSPMACWRIGLDAFSGSRPLLALITPPRDTRVFAHSGLDRYSCTLTVASESSNAATISPPPVTTAPSLPPPRTGMHERPDVAVFGHRRRRRRGEEAVVEGCLVVERAVPSARAAAGGRRTALSRCCRYRRIPR